MLKHVFSGFGSLFNITTPPLYRYPYRFNDEGLRGDMAKVSQDVCSVLGKGETDET